ncbi:alpha/beta fold hydrolase [Actinomycetospora corticicola]|uniref:Pimeloyl-ACP methyl ester carboxylesterase n=1 Tax=Actinomycetospora corticicola TaxID=663602 RepID=A0A7Y9E216_9PSEU|nr:alpha/beta fold hydrolase [Actinomycetospora corticicola]NYD39582.1 pimeloyl-ACP methyl ester carboxylesterase [Actinomycetospora corticicola]
MNVVLIPGACHGAWWYAPVVENLAARGHRALALTLPGLCERAEEQGATLAAHVADVTATVAALDGPVVLVGHSYGGMVVAGVADALPEKVVGLLSVDGFAPADGDSCWSSVDDAMRAWYVDASGRSGTGVDPMPQFDPRTTPHPLASLVQRIRLTGAYRGPQHYALAADPAWAVVSPFPVIADRLRTDPAWTVTDLATTHNVLREGPDVLVAAIEALLAEVDQAG